MTEKYLNVIQQQRLGTTERCAVWLKKWFNVKVELHQGLSLNPFLG